MADARIFYASPLVPSPIGDIRDCSDSPRKIVGSFNFRKLLCSFLEKYLILSYVLSIVCTIANRTDSDSFIFHCIHAVFYKQIWQIKKNK